MAGAFAERRIAGVQHGGARFHGLEETHGGQTRSGMAVQVDRDADGGAQGCYQFEGGVGREQTGHILDAKGIAAQCFQFTGQQDELRNVMHRTGGIADTAFGMFTGFFHRFNRDAQVAHVVHRIKNAEHIHPVVGRFGNECTHHVIGIVAVAEQILSAQQHLDAAVRQSLAQFSEAFPRVFFQKSHAGIESRAAPCFQRPEANAIQLGTDGQHVVGAHARCDDGLMAVTQD